jgi:hypothetical protein
VWVGVCVYARMLVGGVCACMHVHVCLWCLCGWGGCVHVRTCVCVWVGCVCVHACACAWVCACECVLIYVLPVDSEEYFTAHIVEAVAIIR